MIMSSNKNYEPSLASTSGGSRMKKHDWDDGNSTLMTEDDQVQLLEYKQGVDQELMNDDQPIGILPEYCQHENILHFDLKPKAMSFSGLDMFVLTPEQDGSVKTKVQSNQPQPFYIQGKKLITATLSDADHKQIYSMHQNWSSFKSSYYAKNGQGEKVLEVKEDTCFKFNLTATFQNTACPDQKEQTRKLFLKTGFCTEMNELRDERGRLLAIFQRPKKGKMNEFYRIKIAPKVDSTMVLAICMAMHTQLLTFKVATYGIPSAAASASRKS